MDGIAAVVVVEEDVVIAPAGDSQELACLVRVQLENLSCGKKHGAYDMQARFQGWSNVKIKQCCWIGKRENREHKLGRSEVASLLILMAKGRCITFWEVLGDQMH